MTKVILWFSAKLISKNLKSKRKPIPIVIDTILLVHIVISQIEYVRTSFTWEFTFDKFEVVFFRNLCSKNE